MYIRKDAVYVNNGADPTLNMFILVVNENVINKDIHIIESRKIEAASKGASCVISLDKLYFTDGWFLKHYNLRYQLDWSRPIDVQNSELYKILAEKK